MKQFLFLIFSQSSSLQPFIWLELTFWGLHYLFIFLEDIVSTKSSRPWRRAPYNANTRQSENNGVMAYCHNNQNSLLFRYLSISFCGPHFYFILRHKSGLMGLQVVKMFVFAPTLGAFQVVLALLGLKVIDHPPLGLRSILNPS